MADELTATKTNIKTDEVPIDQYISKQDLLDFQKKMKRNWQVMVALHAGIIRTKMESDTNSSELRLPASARVLLIDDDTDFSREVTILLEMSGFEVITSKQPETDLEMIKAIDLIILDENFPDTARICNQARTQSNVPIILVSADPTGETWCKAVAMGVDACLKKSLSRPELIARIKAIIWRYNCTNCGNQA